MKRELEKLAQPSLSPASQTADSITVRYRPLINIETWLQQRIQDRSINKSLYVTAIAVLFLIFVLTGNRVLLDFVNWLFRSGTAIATGGLAGSTQNAIIFMLSLLACFSAAIASYVFYLRLPTHISLGQGGIRFLWRYRFYQQDGNLITWDQISHLEIKNNTHSQSPLDHRLNFKGGYQSLLSLRMGCIPSLEERAKILEALEKWAPSIKRDAEVIQALELPCEHSKTELWLKALSAPPKRERLTPLSQGCQLLSGRFTIESQLGVGGQGTAYKAFDNQNNAAEVVLKEFILPVYVDLSVRKQALDRFENEASILKSLNHAQIVKLLDYFIEDHRAYLALEHINGQTLKQILQDKGAFPEDTMAPLCHQMCQILDYLHNLSPPVVHRDFTPDNLILKSDGSLTLVDFNVAQQSSSTTTGTVVGKHCYIAPEQFRGRPTAQSDLYSMGATIFFLLTEQEPEPISQLHPKYVKDTISGSFDHIVSGLTAIDPGLRYANAAAVIHDLIQFDLLGT